MANPKTQTVIVTKAFRHRGEDLGVGSVVTLDTPLALEMRQAKRCEIAPPGATQIVVPLKPKQRPPTDGGLHAKVEALTALVEKLLAGKPAKEKASA